MGDQMDQAKGRVKQAAGDLTDDDELKREGKIDEIGGKVKETAEDLADKVGDVVDSVNDRIKDR